MSIQIGGTSFDDCEYDPRGDVLYLSVGPPREPARTLETPEGHAIDYDSGGAVVGMVLLNVRHTLEQHGALTLTWPAERVEASTLAQVLAA